MHCICIRTSLSAASLSEPLRLIVSPLDPIENRRTRSIARTQFSFSRLLTCRLAIKSRCYFVSDVRCNLTKAFFHRRFLFFKNREKWFCFNFQHLSHFVISFSFRNLLGKSKNKLDDIINRDFNRSEELRAKDTKIILKSTE